MKPILSILLMFVVTGPAYASIYLGSQEYPGNPVLAVDARAMGMGGVSLAYEGGLSSFHNPALLSSLTGRQISFSYGLMPVRERVIEEDELSYYNSEIFFSAPSFSLAFPVGKGIAFELAGFPVLDFRYQHKKSIFQEDQPTEMKGLNTIESKGNLTSYTPALSLKLTSWLSVGVSYGVLRGKREGEEREEDFQVGSSTSAKVNAKISGQRVGLGIRLSTGETSIGLFYKCATRVSADWEIEQDGFKTENDYKFKMPESWGIGFSHYYSGSRSELCAEIVHTPWSYFQVEKDTYTERPFYRDTTEFRVGAEHSLSDRVKIRYGFSFLPFYGDRAVEEASFTLGIGVYPSESVQLDIGSTYGKSQFKGFFSSDDRVDETVMRLLFTGRLRF